MNLPASLRPFSVPPQAVLQAFGLSPDAPCQPLGGGYSGQAVFLVGDTNPLVLKQTLRNPLGQIEAIENLRENGSDFAHANLPAQFRRTGSGLWCLPDQEDKFWYGQEYLPQPVVWSPQALTNFLDALARWHAIGRNSSSRLEVPRCVCQRLELWPERPLYLWAGVEEAHRGLCRWKEQKQLTHFCWVDLRLEHVRLRTSQAFGIFDAEAARWDHPAVDLARFLGEYWPAQPGMQRQAIQEYNCSTEYQIEWEFVHWLEQTGAWLALERWLREPKSNQVEERIVKLKQRLASV